MLKITVDEAFRTLQAPGYVWEKMHRCDELFKADPTIADSTQLTTRRQLTQRLESKISWEATQEAYNQLEALRLRYEFADNLVTVMEWISEKWHGLLVNLTQLKTQAVTHEKAKAQEAEALKVVQANLTPQFNTGEFIERREIAKATDAAKRAGAADAVKQFSEPTAAEWQSYRTQKLAIVTVENELKRLQGLPFIDTDGTVVVDAYGNLYVDSKGNILGKLEWEKRFLHTDSKGNVSVDSKGNLVDYKAPNSPHCPECDHVLFNGHCWNPICPNRQATPIKNR
jgi:hypothetical protein